VEKEEYEKKDRSDGDRRLELRRLHNQSSLRVRRISKPWIIHKALSIPHYPAPLLKIGYYKVLVAVTPPQAGNYRAS
jgi:hypothetical protein